MRFENEIFKNQQILLDFNTYLHCKFENCEMVIAGVGGGEFAYNELNGCRFAVTGPAANTLQTLQQWYAQGSPMREIVIAGIEGQAVGLKTMN